MAEVTQSSTFIAFHEITKQLIEASISAWPEDALLPLALQTWSALEPEASMTLFETHFGSLSGRLALKEPEALFEAGRHAALEAIQIETKFKAASEATQNTLWTYIGHMCRFTSMNKLYAYIPGNVLSAVTDAAKDLKDKLDAGDIDTNTINPMELGQSVMSKFKPEELESMMKGIMSNPDIMNNLMSQMNSVLDSKQGDMSQLLKFLGK
jgi:hypothetical protein